MKVPNKHFPHSAIVFNHNQIKVIRLTAQRIKDIKQLYKDYNTYDDMLDFVNVSKPNFAKANVEFMDDEYANLVIGLLTAREFSQNMTYADEILIFGAITENGKSYTKIIEQQLTPDNCSQDIVYKLIKDATGFPVDDYEFTTEGFTDSPTSVKTPSVKTPRAPKLNSATGTFKVAGVSEGTHGVWKVRFANDLTDRIYNLTRAGHKTIKLIELPSEMTKYDAMLYLQKHPDFQDNKSQQLIADFLN